MERSISIRVVLQEARKEQRMQLPEKLECLLDAALDGCPPSKQDCIYLLNLPPESFEASIMTGAADVISRGRFGNEAMLLGQIGVDIAPCPGNCGFCAFGRDHTAFQASQLSLEEIVHRANSFTNAGDLYALFLMTMHEFNLERLLETVEAVRSTIPAHTQIVVNIGDFDSVQAREIKAAGAAGAYHVCRLGEGCDTALQPEARKRTFRAIKDAGLDFYYCCEPIGPEHQPEELVQQMFIGIDYGCFQHAAMRRVFVPGIPLSAKGQITERRLAQIVAVVTLASLGCPETKNIAVHEPNLLGLAAGANAVYAESGANPRDSIADTEQNRGLDVSACRKMLYEAGFTALRRGDGTVIGLNLEYSAGFREAPQLQNTV